jgi:hypothetical protein
MIAKITLRIIQKNHTHLFVELGHEYKEGNHAKGSKISILLE